jgi:hypothetical protein
MQVLALNLTPWPPLHEWKRGKYFLIEKNLPDFPASNKL